MLKNFVTGENGSIHYGQYGRWARQQTVEQKAANNPPSPLSVSLFFPRYHTYDDARKRPRWVHANPLRVTMVVVYIGTGNVRCIPVLSLPVGYPADGPFAAALYSDLVWCEHLSVVNRFF